MKVFIIIILLLLLTWTIAVPSTAKPLGVETLELEPATVTPIAQSPLQVEWRLWFPHIEAGE